MSDRATSTQNWLRESGLQIISAVIGSSLLVTAITTLASEINQPNLSLNVIPHYRPQPQPTNVTETDIEYYEIIVNNKSLIVITQYRAQPQPTNVTETEVQYYEIIVNNNGRRQATNMILSAYFDGSILNTTTPFFSGEALSFPVIENISAPQNTPENQQINGSLVRWDIPRLASGAMMIFNVRTSPSDSATRFDPYYVTAIFDEGSKTYPVFGTSDIELGRFPNILAGMEEAQTTQRIIVTSIILCAIFFTIAIKYNKIKEIIKERKEGRKWSEIKFDLLLALPITMLSSILIFYICEEIPLTALLHYLIMPPLDVSDGPPVDKLVTYKTGEYKQGDLLLSAGIFWSISFAARSVLSYLIAKVLIPKFHEEFKEKPINTQYLGISSIVIMGAPLASTVMLFFSKSTYSISPVYLFFLFLVIDMIRMFVLVIVIPKISIKSNKLFNYGLNALSIVTGLLHLLLFVTLFRTQSMTPEHISDFLDPLMYICLIGGILQLSQIALMKFKEKMISRSRGLAAALSLAAALFSVVLIVVWIGLIDYITSSEQKILSIGSPVITGSPIILTGLIVIVLNIAYIGLARATDIRKIKAVKLQSWLDPLKTSNTGNDSSSKPCYPVELPIPVTVQLEYDDSNGKVSPEEKTKIIENKTITFHNGESKVDDNCTSPAIDEEGNFKYKVKAPSHVGPFEMQVRFEGSSEWNSSSRPETQSLGKGNWKSKIFFNITVTPSTNSRDNQENRNRLKYGTRLRNTSLSVFTGTMKKDGRFTKTKEFKPGELVTFQVSLFDNDEHKSISGQKDIMLILYGEDTKKVTNPLPPTDNNGNTYASIRAASKPSDGYIFKASYPGNSIYANADSKVQSYSVKY